MLCDAGSYGRQHLSRRKINFMKLTRSPRQAKLQEFVERHRKQIEPWLSAVFQSEHLALLVGNGFSVGLASSVGAQPAEMKVISIVEALDGKIIAAAKASAATMGRGEPNIEDQIRACVTLLGGLEILDDAQAPVLRQALRRELVKFANSIIDMEAGILGAVKDEQKWEVFRSLLASFLLSFASRTATRDKLHIFTTNYDRIIEYGFDLVGIPSGGPLRRRPKPYFPIVPLRR